MPLRWWSASSVMMKGGGGQQSNTKRGPIFWRMIYGMDLNTQKGLLLVAGSPCILLVSTIEGLALASSDSSSGSGLSSLGNALAEELINGMPGSSGVATDLSDGPTVGSVAGSLTGSGTLPPSTPPSVTKPPVVQSTPKAPVLSDVKRALQYE